MIHSMDLSNVFLINKNSGSFVQLKRANRHSLSERPTKKAVSRQPPFSLYPIFHNKDFHLTIASITIIDAPVAPTNTNQQAQIGTVV